MVKLIPLTFLLCLLAMPSLRAQNYGFPFNNLLEMACPYDSTDTIYMSTNYRFFSTLDDNYFGEIDSSICYTLDTAKESFNTYQVPPGRKLFAECIMEDTLPLLPHTANRVYGIFQDWSGLGCDSVGCKKVILETWVPDSAGTGEIVRPRI